MKGNSLENMSKDQDEEYIAYEPEEPQEMLKFISFIISLFIEKVIPEKPRALTFEKAGKCLKILGKIWNLSEHPPADYSQYVPCKISEEKLMDMEGYVDEYQYLHIEALDLSLTDIRVIPKNFIWLLSADLSGNRLTNTTACPITKLPNLVALKLNRNRIENPYLPPMKHLQYLGLNSNKITSLHRIYHPNLETLDLNYNLVKAVDPGDCWKHTKLAQLDLRGNQLTTTSGIEYSSLVNLYLAQNKITELKGLNILVNLQRIHLRENPLSDLRGFSEQNINLKYVNIRKCQVQKMEDIKNLSILKGLKELILKGNIFNPEKEKITINREKSEEETDEDADEENSEKQYSTDVDDDNDNDINTDEEQDEIRIHILSYIPTLVRIDKKLVTAEEKRKMRDFLDGSET